MQTYLFYNIHLYLHIYGVEHGVIYNPLKSVCIVFKPDRFSLKCPLVHLGNNVLENQENLLHKFLLCSSLV